MWRYLLCLSVVLFPAVTALSQTDIAAFTFASQTGSATINTANHTVEVEVVHGTDLHTLIADFTLSGGATASLDGIQIFSGSTSIDYSFPVIITVTDELSNSQDWTITITQNHPTSIHFEKIVTGEMVTFKSQSNGICWTDYNNDGFPDAYIGGYDEANRLYKNNGDGTFTNVSGILATGVAAGTWADFDNDDDFDLVVTADAVGVPIEDTNQKAFHINNGDETFTKSILTVPATVGGTLAYNSAFGDYDGDGDLDVLYLVEGGNNLFFINNGDGTFTENTTSTIATDPGESIDASWVDIDNDLDVDLFVTNNQNGGGTSNALYLNNGDGTFSKVTSGEIVTDVGNFETQSWADVNRDGFLDVFLSSNGGQGFLFINNGDGTFNKVTDITGDGIGISGSNLGSVFADFDNDGDDDLYITYTEGTGPNRLLDNNGDGTFTEITGTLLNFTGQAWGVATADYDRNGFPDLMVAQFGQANSFFRNTGNSHNWISIELDGEFTNSKGVGARVLVTADVAGAGEVTQTKQLMVTSGLRSQSEQKLLFGLGQATECRVEVYWPSGRYQEVLTLASNDWYTITEASSEAAFYEFTLSPVPDPAEFTSIGQFEQSHYYISESTTTWAEAKDLAVAAGGQLLIIETEEENDFIAANTPETGWIGLTDEMEEGTFVWIDGTTPAFGKWSPNEPNGGTSENAAQIYPGTGEWNDFGATEPLRFIVEVPVDLGEIDYSAHTVHVELPLETPLSSLKTSFVLPTGATAKIGATDQLSGTTVNDFSNPVTYTITAEDGITTLDWVVTATNGAVAYYPFNGNAADEFQGGQEATVLGPVLGTDRFGAPDRAYSFQQGDFILRDVLETSPQVFTVNIWFKSVEGGGLIGFGGPEAVPTQWDRSITMAPNGIISFYVFPGEEKTINSPSAWNGETWHMATATLSADGMQLYVDGTLVSEEVSVTAAEDVNGYWRIGNNFKGSLDEVRVYSRKLSVAEIEALYLSEKPSSEAEILTWSIDGAEPATIDDANSTIELTIAHGFDLHSLVPTFTASEGATLLLDDVQLESGATAADFSIPAKITVTAQDGFSTREWTLTVNRDVHNEIHFEKITSGEIVTFKEGSSGISWTDINNDGYPDVYISGYGSPNRLYKNNGDGRFTNITDKLEMGVADGTWADFDNDGDFDLVVTADNVDLPLEEATHKTFHINNGDETFTKAILTTPAAPSGTMAYNSAFGDYDNDGDLDVLHLVEGGVNHFFENNGDGTFTENTSSIISTDPGQSLDASWVDIDNDGDIDLFVTNNNNQEGVGTSNALYLNNGDKTFSKITTGEIVTNTGNFETQSWADIDNNGFPDVYVGDNFGSGLIFSNQGDGSFAGIGAIAQGGNLGSVFADYDNDGDEDLFLTYNDGISPLRLLQNNGDGSFTEITGTLLNEFSNGWGLAVADYDRNGFLDLMVANFDQANTLFKNTGNGNNWLNIELQGVASNSKGVGARVVVTANIAGTDGVAQTKQVKVNSGLRSQSEPVLHFGLGQAAGVGKIEVFWPSGRYQLLTEVDVNQWMTISESSSAANFIAYALAPVPDPVQFTSLGPFGSTSYYISNDGATWTDAVESAAQAGGHLVVINSAQENAFLAGKILEPAWIGLSDEQEEGSFQWLDGSQLELSNWIVGEFNGGESENAVEIAPGTGYWKDNNNTVIQKFVMEIPGFTGTSGGDPGTIAVNVPFGIELTNLAAIFRISTGAVARVGEVEQVSGSTLNDFTDPVIYTITAEDGSSRNWTVTAQHEGQSDTEDPIIQVPASIANTYRRSSGGFYVEATFSDNTGVSVMELRYKKGRESQYRDALLNVDGQVGSYTFNDGDFDELGLQFYFYAEDNFDNSATSDTRFVALEFDDGDENISGLTAGTATTDYQIIAIPFQRAPVSEIFSELMPANKSEWRLIHYNNGYIDYNSGFSNFDPGLGYWFLSRSESSISLGSGNALGIDANDPFIITLDPGWNMIGNPYLFAVDWNDLVQQNIQAGNLSNGDLTSPLFVYRERSYNSASTLDKFEGGFVQASKQVQIFWPAVGGSGGRFLEEDLSQPVKLEKPEWTLPIFIQTNQFAYNLLGVGFHPEARVDIDHFDWPSPPLPGDFFQVAFNDNNGNRLPLSRSIVPGAPDFEWKFEIKAEEGSAVVFRWPSSAITGGEYELVLIDEPGRRAVAMSEADHYDFTASSKNNFSLRYLPTTDWLKLQKELSTTIESIYPNPFKSEITIRVTNGHLDKFQSARLQLINLAGGVVTPAHSLPIDSGKQLLTWRPENQVALQEGPYILHMILENSEFSIEYSQIILYEKGN